MFSKFTMFVSVLGQVRVRWGEVSECEAMGCTSAKQVSAVPNDEEGRGKAYSNGDLFTGQYTHTRQSFTAPFHSVNCSAQTHLPPLPSQYILFITARRPELSSPFQTVTANATVLLESSVLTVHVRKRKWPVSEVAVFNSLRCCVQYCIWRS